MSGGSSSLRALGAPAAALVAVLAACSGSGPHLQPLQPLGRGAGSARPGGSARAGAPSASSSAHLDAAQALRLTYSAIGCFTGGAWVEALGALGEERTLATTRRCRTLATEGLGRPSDDNAAFVACRSIDPKAVDVIAAAVERIAGSDRADLVALVRATSDAAREASEARRISNTLRKNASATVEPALGSKEALARLHVLKAGAHTTTAKLVALVLAADHVESSRGLAAGAKVLAAAPAFEVVFGVAPPATAGEGAWIGYAAAAAKAGGHPTADSSEASAFAGVVASFGDKFDALVRDLPAGEPQEVASGYAKRLRTELSEAAKNKGK